MSWSRARRRCRPTRRRARSPRQSRRASCRAAGAPGRGGAAEGEGEGVGEGTCTCVRARASVLQPRTSGAAPAGGNWKPACDEAGEGAAKLCAPPLPCGDGPVGTAPPHASAEGGRADGLPEARRAPGEGGSTAGHADGAWSAELEPAPAAGALVGGKGTPIRCGGLRAGLAGCEGTDGSALAPPGACSPAGGWLTPIGTAAGRWAGAAVENWLACGEVSNGGLLLGECHIGGDAMRSPSAVPGERASTAGAAMAAATALPE